jgi:chromosome segregation ATPase
VEQIRSDLQDATANVRKMQSTIDSMMVLAESSSTEMSELKAWKRDAEKTMEEQSKGLKDMEGKISILNNQCEEKQEKIIDKETELSFLHGECEEQKQYIVEMQSKVEQLEQELGAVDCTIEKRLESAECKRNVHDMVLLDFSSGFLICDFTLLSCEMPCSRGNARTDGHKEREGFAPEGC